VFGRRAIALRVACGYSAFGEGCSLGDACARRATAVFNSHQKSAFCGAIVAK